MQQNDASHRLLEAHLGPLCTDEMVIREVVSLFRTGRYPRGDYFSAMGEETDRLGFVVDGVFCMSTVLEDGRLFVKDFLTREQFLLAAFEPGGPAAVSIQSLTNATVLEAPYSVIRSLLEKHPEIERAARRGVERRTEELYRRLESFATMEARERYQLFRKNFETIEDCIPQYLIASYLGITPTQLSRIRHGR
jgi:CRP-like cAMP-binding protein